MVEKKKSKPVPFMKSFEVVDKKHQLKRYGALAASLFAIESWKEPVLAFLVHLLCWQNGGQGPSCIYSALSGIHLQKFRWLGYVPIVVNISDLDEPKATTYAHLGAMTIGWVAAYIGWV